MSMRGGEERDGFTIVELLIVVVVIAILAAITIVAYNGIRNQATSSSVRAAANQFGKKIQAFAVTNAGQVPAESSFITDLSLPAQSSTNTYDYFVNSLQNRFCFSVTDTLKSLSFAYTDAGQSVEGRCVKNLISNPSFETLSSGSVVGLTPSSRSTVTSSTSQAIYGARSALVVPTYSTNDTFADIANWGVQADTTYAISLSYTLTSATSSIPRFRFNIGNVDRQSTGVNVPGTHTLNWTYAVGSSASVNFLRIMPGGLQGDPGIYADGLMVTQTPDVYKYGDGDMPGWAWVGAPHASPSFGPSTRL